MAFSMNKKLGFEYCLPTIITSAMIYGLLVSALAIRTNLATLEAFVSHIGVQVLFGSIIVSILWFSYPGLLILATVALLIYASNEQGGWFYAGMMITMVVSLELVRGFWGEEESKPVSKSVSDIAAAGREAVPGPLTHIASIEEESITRSETAQGESKPESAHRIEHSSGG